MSRISKVIKDLQNIQNEHGDIFVLEWNIVDESGGMSSFRYSPDRTDRLGRKMKMNKKEFIQWCDDQNNKEHKKKTLCNTLPDHGFAGHVCGDRCNQLSE